MSSPPTRTEGSKGDAEGGFGSAGAYADAAPQGMRSVSQSSVRSWNGDVASQRYQASGGSRAAGSAEGQLLDHIPPAEIMPPVLLAEPPRGPYRDPTILPEISSPVADAAAAAAAARSSPASGSDREGSSDPTAFMSVFRTPRSQRGGSGVGESSAGLSSVNINILQTPNAMMTDSPLSDLAEVANLLASGGSLSEFRGPPSSR